MFVEFTQKPGLRKEKTSLWVGSEDSSYSLPTYFIAVVRSHLTKATAKGEIFSVTAAITWQSKSVQTLGRSKIQGCKIPHNQPSAQR
ncbi:hypothetical protein QUA56_11205 [Microcoleus sp. N3A4]|uniref:hypothetical protein n=1 Tax=Microcoleus sp. N3A4 TaxID=3055379 RepID=UPI002FD203A2